MWAGSQSRRRGLNGFARENETKRTVPPFQNGFITAPESIQEDPLFGMLVADGSLETGVDERQRKVLEKEPEAGVSADGKKKRTAGS